MMGRGNCDVSGVVGSKAERQAHGDGKVSMKKLIVNQSAHKRDDGHNQGS